MVTRGPGYFPDMNIQGKVLIPDGQARYYLTYSQPGITRHQLTRQEEVSTAFKASKRTPWKIEISQLWQHRSTPSGRVPKKQKSTVPPEDARGSHAPTPLIRFAGPKEAKNTKPWSSVLGSSGRWVSNKGHTHRSYNQCLDLPGRHLKQPCRTFAEMIVL